MRFKNIAFLMAVVSMAAATQERTTAPKVVRAVEYVLASDQTPSNVRLFAETESVTVNVLAPNAAIKPHYHAKHDETVYIVQGGGRMRIGDEERNVKAGDLIFLPRGTIHSFTPDGTDCVAISIFTPKFDGVDRVFVGGQAVSSI